jgi:hypothetical protein
MNRIFKGLLLAASASFLVACGGPSPLSKALDHQIAMLKIVEANKSDVAKATSELDQYVKTNEAAFKEILKGVGEMKAETKTKSASEAMGVLQDHSDQLKARAELQKKLREEALPVFRDPKVSELLDTIRTPW